MMIGTKINEMKIFTRIIIALLALIVLGVIGYATWYEWDRAQKIAHNRECDEKAAVRDSELTRRDAVRIDRSEDDNPADIVAEFPPCAYELVPPTLRELLFGGRDGSIGPTMIRPCDQSATTSDCVRELPVPPALDGGQPITRYPYKTSYPLVDSVTVNELFTIHNNLWTLPSETCAVDFKTRGIVIDDTEVISRIFSLAARNPDAEWARTLCHTMTDVRESVTGVRERTVTNVVMVIETQDPGIFSASSEMGLPGTVFRVFIYAHEFIVSPGTGRIYTSSSFDGSLGEDIGGLWDEYENAEVGVAFSYPYTGGNQGKWSAVSGDTGRIWSATIGLPEYGASITLSSKTANYSAPKGGHVTPTEGFIEKDDAYYPLRRGEPRKAPFVPDEVWQSADGRPILVKIAKRDTYDFTADYPEPPIQAVMNLDSAFTGVGIWYGKDKNIFPTTEDTEMFKRIITSLHATP